MPSSRLPLRRALSISRLIAFLRPIHDPRSLRLALGLSQTEMGAALHAAHPCPHFKDRPIRQATISMWESGRGGRWRMTADTREAYRRVLAEFIQRQTLLGFQVRISGVDRWSVELLRHCQICQRPFIMERSNQTKCARHRSK